MTYLYLYIPGMAHEVQLSESADRIPNMGDRLEIDAVRLDKSSRNLLETTPACHCFEKNAETERQSLAEYLAESVVTVTGRRSPMSRRRLTSQRMDTTSTSTASTRKAAKMPV